MAEDSCDGTVGTALIIIYSELNNERSEGGDEEVETSQLSNAQRTFLYELLTTGADRKSKKAVDTTKAPSAAEHPTIVEKMVICRHCGYEHKETLSLGEGEYTPCILEDDSVKWVKASKSKPLVICRSFTECCPNCELLISSWSREELEVRYFELLRQPLVKKLIRIREKRVAVDDKGDAAWNR